MRAGLLALLLASCGAPLAPSAADGGDTPDAGTVPFDTCDDACRRQTLAFERGGERLPFTQAAFGLTPPARSAHQVWELYLEAWEGGFEGCPANDSPVPERTLILSGIGLSSEPVSRTQEDGASATLLDFAATILPGDEPSSKATALRLGLLAAKPCAEAACAEEERFVALDVEATFAEGRATGRLFALHCASLDE